MIMGPNVDSHEERRKVFGNLRNVKQKNNNNRCVTEKDRRGNYPCEDDKN